MRGSRKASDAGSTPTSDGGPDFSLAPPCRDVPRDADDEATEPSGAIRTMSHHTLSVLVENRPGVLTRCAGLFARRGFNIASLAVGTTQDPSRSRITIRV